MLTGIIFGVIVILWVAYLFPWLLQQRQTLPNDFVEVDRFSDSVHIVRSGVEEEFLTDSGADVSTPLIRRALRYNLRRAARTAVQRRRRGLVVHLVALVVGIIVPFIAPISHWWTALPAGMLVVWLVISRISVVTMQRMIDRLNTDIAQLNDEDTVIIAVRDEETGEIVETERSVEITDQLADSIGSLWDPIPVTPMTYVARPLLPRSVRTIDLSAPVASSELRVPVIADKPAATTDDTWDKAVGE